jgi:hypothetical protein
MCIKQIKQENTLVFDFFFGSTPTGPASAISSGGFDKFSFPGSCK